MHKCPTCKVPLHGWEEECPSCGTKQQVRKSERNYGGQKAPGVNPMPFVVGLIAVGAFLVFAMNSSWIGAVMRRGPETVDPLAGVTYLQARQTIEQKITEGLTSVGAKGKFKWTVGGQPGDIKSPNPIELTVDTSLSDPTARKQIIDPIKDYMTVAKLPSLTMNDAKSHATWTYTASLVPAGDESADPSAQGDAPAN
ncbi:MAG: hypothetical protein IAF58_12275 [Leptolyngbya sp.]|nr:hypothetical protein [Candidatus Melainabacteria bacterium]